LLRYDSSAIRSGRFKITTGHLTTR
jgi:hypothetical protein